MSNNEKHTYLDINDEWFDYFKMTNSITLYNPSNPDDKLEFLSVKELLDFNRKIWELKKQTEWQPIETAPKDGSAIIICYYHNAHSSIKYTATTHWGDDYGWRVFYDYFISDIDKHITVTHWMPLPEPPQN